jgi:hypothetical protein
VALLIPVALLLLAAEAAGGFLLFLGFCIGSAGAAAFMGSLAVPIAVAFLQLAILATSGLLLFL